jgi:hypothetical protein
MKDAFYFPHYSNARNDRKLKRVIKSLGVEGYGIYFMLLEVLRDQTEFRYPMADIDLLADEFGTSEAKVAAVIRNFDLFNIDDEQSFFSINLIKYLEPMFKMRDQRSIAGKASGEARRAKLLGANKEVQEATFEEMNDRSTTVQRMMNENEQSKEEESKVKESKGNKITYTEEFESVWEAYKRKGSKAPSFNEWKKMSYEDKELAKKHIIAYVESKKDNLKYMKDFERYLKDQTYHSIIITYKPDNIFKGGSW